MKHIQINKHNRVFMTGIIHPATRIALRN